MPGWAILLVGVLVVVAMLVITSAIMVLAPYVAGAIVIIGLAWIALKFEKIGHQDGDKNRPDRS